VRITDAALAAAATLSDAYLPDRQLPDKALAPIDEAAAKVRLFFGRRRMIRLGAEHAAGL
jgi:ATP-dependent Clp protease ATP-binding subunit ClpC